jgi:cell division protein FtsB
MKRVKKYYERIPKPLRNKYILTILFFIFWIIFLDDYNLIKQNQLQKEVEELENQKNYYTTQIKKDSTELYNLKNTAEQQEKFAREKFLMKKDNEEVFILRDKTND